VNHATFDSLTRRTSLAGASLGLAAMALPFAADAKNKSKKKGKKKARQKCQDQVETCSTLVGDLRCGSDPEPECLAFVENCCQSLATCDFTGLIACLNTPV
jgi:hypothetical protein